MRCARLACTGGASSPPRRRRCEEQLEQVGHRNLERPDDQAHRRQHLALLEDASVQQILLRVGDAVRKRGNRGERRGNEGLRTLNVTQKAHVRVGMLFLINSIAIGETNDGSSMARKYG